MRQPWASLIGSGRKTVELRNWATAYRGPLLICAGGQRHALGREYECGPMGVAIALVDLVDVRAATPGDAPAACIDAPDFRFAWVFENARAVEPVRVKGQLQLFRVMMPRLRSTSPGLGLSPPHQGLARRT